jgi:ElaB/YqjD/DUF883 family membrane-anchored ribosome-binding protein
MAVSEGQLTLEFMQALTAEAQAHRAYLQLLYAVTLGVVGGGLVILAGVFVWLGQRSLTQMKENLNAAFDARIGSLFEERSKEADEKFAEIKQTIDSLRQFRSTAEREMDVIASIASEAKAATRVDVEDNFPKIPWQCCSFPIISSGFLILSKVNSVRSLIVKIINLQMTILLILGNQDSLFWIWIQLTQRI